MHHPPDTDKCCRNEGHLTCRWSVKWSLYRVFFRAVVTALKMTSTPASPVQPGNSPKANTRSAVATKTATRCTAPPSWRRGLWRATPSVERVYRGKKTLITTYTNHSKSWEFNPLLNNVCWLELRLLWGFKLIFTRSRVCVTDPD